MSLSGSPVLQVLVVDDNDNAAQSMALLLRCAGHEVVVANTGPAAVEAVGGWAPHVVVLDIGLPGMDGVEVARLLRSGPGGQALRLIALTGLSDPADRQRGLEAGIDVYLIKPVPPEELLEVLWPAGGGG